MKKQIMSFAVMVFLGLAKADFTTQSDLASIAPLLNEPSQVNVKKILKLIVRCLSQPIRKYRRHLNSPRNNTLMLTDVKTMVTVSGVISVNTSISTTKKDNA